MTAELMLFKERRNGVTVHLRCLVVKIQTLRGKIFKTIYQTRVFKFYII